ncbi:Undecaprenyl-phosphate galactose phosphotransferase, WbaP/exopolysaccharide biosynthesis polyprenyl glycosylphosphotransferase [Bradyrhizobium lablabi]|uniref:Undecaprenyl-phosphate galactose phosphotransferase, WbaP/exopolysaccharide biosynthesis polyprenyl glycosylphosphotransferase n=1 Tax=Bradyrhizobium lablabi TaxID=722472 RepID=A0A1M6JCI4_9BRAD|nr:exopolysaccharide biosynthesis polyprenyl glycosylphosphotransferase [Bradyrhizobium lablabi]SHJ44407.1 Undecaprenyl-phosphate galactose phosphotransferase, WbaP/exopolysaccharide biosynthesis polyprenyl glycosylphosphotransferase [Bradyrhizobium lablabi]
MADEGLNLHPAGPARLRRRSRRDRDFGLVYRYRKPIVVASLVCGDLAAALAAILCTHLLIRMTGLPSPAPQRVTASFVVLAFFVVGLYTGSGPGPYERFRLRSIGIAGLIAISTIATLPERNVIDFMIVQFANAACLLLIGHYIEATTRGLLIYTDLWGASTVLVGAADHCQKLAHLLARNPELGLKPIGLIRTADASNSKGEPFPIPVIGTTTDFGNIRPRTEIEVAVFATTSELAAVPRDCPAFAPSCCFMLLEDIHYIQGPWVHARTMGTMIGVEIRRNLCSWQSRLLKRTFDILVAITIALLVLPAVALAALMIKLVDQGPAFYVQKRIGHNGTTIKVLKLRTMYADSERLLEEHLRRDPQARAEWQRFFKLRRDPRILPIVGNFLRSSSADELPQLWNVICGDMSLVGPRPLPAYHAEQFDEEFRLLRIGVMPGITGLWQVSSRSDGDLQILREQDLFYIRNWSPWLDLYILLQTVPAVLGAKGAR